LKVLKEAGHGKLKESKQQNEELLSSLISLEEEKRKLEASISFIQNLKIPVRINLHAKGERIESPREKNRWQLRSSDEFESLSLSQNDKIAKEILDQITSTINEDEEYLDLILKRNRLISTQKKLQSLDFNDFMMKNLFDENNNLLDEKIESKEKKDPRLTRRRKRTIGGSLIDPRKFYVCLICGDKHMDYSISKMKHHYKKSHGYEVGPGPLPKTKSQIEETIAKDRQKSTTCHLCDAVFDNLDDLLLHKSLHVNPKFCQHKCSVKNCQEAFVLKEHLENHQMVHET